MISLPVSTRASPVEHFVHGCHTVTAHWRNVTAGHNGVIHPRMYCQLLLDAEENCQRQRKNFTFLIHVWHHVMTWAYLGEQSFARAWRTVHEDVPVQASVLPCVPCRYGNVTHTLFQRRLTKTDRHKWLRCNLFMSKQAFLCLLTLSTTPSRASWGLLFRRLAVLIVSGGQKW